MPEYATSESVAAEAKRLDVRAEDIFAKVRVTVAGLSEGVLA
jgi:hypothetical protein